MSFNGTFSYIKKHVDTHYQRAGVHMQTMHDWKPWHAWYAWFHFCLTSSTQRIWEGLQMCLILRVWLCNIQVQAHNIQLYWLLQSISDGDTSHKLSPFCMFHDKWRQLHIQIMRLGTPYYVLGHYYGRTIWNISSSKHAWQDLDPAKYFTETLSECLCDFELKDHMMTCTCR